MDFVDECLYQIRDRPKTGFVIISRFRLLRRWGRGERASEWGLKPSTNRRTFSNIVFMSLSFSNEIKNIITNFLPEFEFIAIFTFDIH